MAFDPIPVPVRGSATFNADAEAFALGISQFAEDYNALSSVIDASLTSTSTTSLTIGTGSKTLTVQTGLGYVIGYPLRIANTADPTNFMDGIVTAYNTGTGSLTVNVLSFGGSGTLASWNTMVLPGGGNFASLSYNKFTARQVFANEVSIASASTIDFTTGNSNQFLITGTNAISAVTMDQGAVIKARFAAACQLTHGTNLQIQGGSNYTTSAGDIVTFTSNGTVVRAEISNADGRPINLTVINSTNDPTYASTSGNDPISAQWLKDYLASRRFVSSEQSMTAGGLLTIPHGLGAVPSLTYLTLKCTTADGTNSVGDLIDMGGVSEASSQSAGTEIRKDATNLYVRIGSGGIVLLNTSGTVYNITLSNYRLIATAEL